MQKTLLILSMLLWLNSCATPKRVEEPKTLFVDHLPSNTALSLENYLQHQKLENGVEYGSFVRNFHLKGESAVSLKEKLSHTPCNLKVDEIREPKNNTPIKDKKGNTTPIWIWLCKDGGVIRIKPLGDPMNKFRPQAHGSKALRYPATGEFHGFNDETIKIDEAGNPLPKWPADLKSKDPIVINNWANAAHTDLNN